MSGVNLSGGVAEKVRVCLSEKLKNPDFNPDFKQDLPDVNLY